MNALKLLRKIFHLKSLTLVCPIRPVGLSKHVLTIEVPSMFYHEFIEGNFWELLKTAIKSDETNGKLEYKIPYPPQVEIKHLQ